MKKILAIILCLLVLVPCCVPVASAKKEETEVEFTLDFTATYTDIVEVGEDDIHDKVDKTDENTESKRIVYIALLSSALVVSVVILVVTLKRVPSEEEIDISGTGKRKKSQDEEKE